MFGGKRIIAVCTTRLHDVGRTEYIGKLHLAARENNSKLLVFNSFIDFYNQDALDIGAKSVYSIMNYDIIDVVVIIYDSFYDRTIADEIIDTAQAHKKPVILINGEKEGCWSIVPDYISAFTAIMEHVISQHGITDTFFVAGTRGNTESEKRIACYKQVLENHQLLFEEDRIDYGDYWDGPTRKIIQRLVKDGKKPPKAIFCANDYMAFAVCDELSLHGYQVPEDVVVTGFDGVPASEHFTPQLTTCRADNEELAHITLSVVDMALNSSVTPKIINNPYSSLISESCGCKKIKNEHFRETATNLFNTIDAMQIHEEFVFAWIDQMLEITDMNSLYATIANCILGNSYVCLNNDFKAQAITVEKGEEHFLTEELTVISSVYSNSVLTSDKMKKGDMLPELGMWITDETLSVINAVYVGAQVCGYYIMNTDDIAGNIHKIKRVAKAVNIACTVAANYFRQQNMNLRIQRATITNAVTGLPNLKGAVQWFDEFAQQESNYRKSLTFSVYGLAKYTYILENYGIKAAEDALRMVAESLKIANSEDCYIAHIAEDEFVVINYYEDGNKIGEVINNATSAFFGMIESYNNRSNTEYFVEVSCGCTVANPGWQGALESFIKFANAEMYMNRIKTGMGEVVKTYKVPQEQYAAFNILIEKNLFHYHFQPIVNAKTGEIFAYEALMRTDASIGMSPLEVLDVARQYNRLYDIERATLFNILDRYTNEFEKFGARKVFINTIPGYFLKTADRQLLAEKYGTYMNKVVFELTEQGTVSDEELSSIKQLCGQTIGSSIAIDDYGTGHSNIVNLMRYTPQIIKIDRYLIEEVQKNQNKQMFIRSTVEFAGLNHIKVLAEGVETAEELRMVIELGVDLIQGYYTGRPIEEPISAISEEVRKDILRFNEQHKNLI